MKLNIGENIKRPRRSRDITQEEFAEIVGVSCQSVSRWENNTCYPDMELLPTMADFFGVTVDALLGVDDAVEKAKVQVYLDRFQEAVSVGDIDTCIAVSREGVKEFPNNYALLNKLMYALFMAGDEDGNIPNWKENMEKNDAEITALGERIMKYCPDEDIRLEATSRLAFNHCEMGRKAQGRAIYKTMPSSKYCRENSMWWCLEDDERLPFTRNNIRSGYDRLSAGLYTIISYRLLPDEELLAMQEKMFELYNFAFDGNYAPNHWGSAKGRMHYARLYARLGEYDKVYEQLELASDAAIRFDDRPESGVTKTVLFGEEEWKRTDFETDDSRPLCEIMRDKWLANSDFDCVRDTDEFKAVLNKLTR